MKNCFHKKRFEYKDKIFNHRGTEEIQRILKIKFDRKGVEITEGKPSVINYNEINNPFMKNFTGLTVLLVKIISVLSILIINY